MIATLLLVTALPAHAAVWMVGFEAEAPPANLQRSLAANDIEVRRCFKRARFCVVEAPGLSEENLRSLRALPGVRYLEADRPMDLAPRAEPPNAIGTKDCPDPWELDAIRATEAWAVVDGSDAPVIAVQDTGFLTSHVELDGRISGQFDYGNWDTNPEVEWASTVPDHGTFIAGMLVADPDNGLGRAGVAPYAKLNLQKIADNSGALYYSYAASAMADLADGDLGVRVLNYSIGSSSYTQSFYDAVAALEDVGILLVAAAGNCASAHCSDADNDANPMYPASFSLVGPYPLP